MRLGSDAAPELIEPLGQTTAVRRRQPEAEQQPGVAAAGVIGVGGAAVIDDVVVQQLDVAGLERRIEAGLLGDLGEQVQRLVLRVGQSRQFGEFLRLLDIGAGILAGDLAVALDARPAGRK